MKGKRWLAYSFGLTGSSHPEDGSSTFYLIVETHVFYTAQKRKRMTSTKQIPQSLKSETSDLLIMEGEEEQRCHVTCRGWDFPASRGFAAPGLCCCWRFAAYPRACDFPASFRI